MISNNGDQLTMLLTMVLGISFIILIVLVFAFVMISVKRRKKEKEAIAKPEKIEAKSEQNNKSTVLAKAYTTQDIKDFLDFDEIKDNMIVQNKGKRLIMVVQCQGVNYDLMSSMEKVAVEQGFVQFLNTLTSPIQLYIQARKVNLEESLQNYNKRFKNIEARYNKIKLQYEQAQRNEKITKEQFDRIRYEYIRQKNLYDYTNDIIDNTEKMSLNKNILTKNYYMVLSYVPDDAEDLFGKEELLDMAFSELYTKAQSLLRVISVCGVTGRVLDSMELADLLYVAYNRDSSEIYGVDKAIKAGYDSLYMTAQDVIDKKIEALDNMIKERALDLANKTVEEVTIKNKRKRELEDREKNMKKLIKEMAKDMIAENEGYIEKEIVDESIKEIEEKEIVEEKKTKAKKGAK